MEFLTKGADDADGFQGQQDSDGPSGSIRLLRDDFSEQGAFLRRRAHQRDLWIVLIKISALEPGRNRFGRMEIHHVEAAGSDNCGNTIFHRRFETCPGRR